MRYDLVVRGERLGATKKGKIPSSQVLVHADLFGTRSTVAIWVWSALRQLLDMAKAGPVDRSWVYKGLFWPWYDRERTQICSDQVELLVARPRTELEFEDGQSASACPS